MKRIAALLSLSIALSCPGQELTEFPAAEPKVDPTKAAAVAPNPNVFRTIVRKQGDDGVHSYRIPGLATSPKGTLLAVFDMRHASERDLPGDIDVGLMRSTDKSRT